ncbi:hypothetical protein G4B84_008760, partial [Aspergillus flavus NRRL3357]
MANSVREANDWAFQTAIIDIFRKLSLWEQNHRLSLDLGLRGRRVGEKPTPEPNTSYSSIAGDYRHDFTTGRTDAVPPYRARLHNNDASVLAYASCVGKLSFTNKRVAYNALGECQWLALPTPDDQEQIDKIEDWEEEICDWESGCVDRSTNDDEQFHRFFISLGYAARHMPLLRSIEFELNHNPTTSFNFKRDSDTTTAKWESDADPEYRPDERVAKAWGFQLKDMEITGPWDLQSIV